MTDQGGMAASAVADDDDPVRVDLDHDAHAAVHRHREGLRTAHFAQASGQHKLAL